MDATPQLKLLTWNINSIAKRHIAVVQYALANNVDVICLQETKHTTTSHLGISGYQLFEEPSERQPIPHRGLITYVKKSLRATLRPPPTIGEGCSALAVSLSDANGEHIATVVNAYAQAASLNLEEVEQYCNSGFTILAGDLNAIHCTLGRNKTRISNTNGITLYRWLLNSTVNVVNTENPAPTHRKGN